MDPSVIVMMLSLSLSLSDYALLSLDNVPVCNCGEVALLLTVRREDSVNKGKNIV